MRQIERERDRERIIPKLIYNPFTKTDVSPIFRNNGNGHRGNGGISDNESDDDGEEGDYTVYECPGLAPVNTYCPFKQFLT